MLKVKRLCVFTMAAVLVLGASTAMAGKKVEWSFTSSMMNTHPVVANSFIPLFEKMKKESGDRLEITVYNPNAIVPYKEMWAALKRGVVNVVASGTARFPNEFPAVTLSDYPFLFNTSRAAGFSTVEMYKNNPDYQKDLGIGRLFAISTSTPFDIVSTKPIHKLEDLKGMRIGVLDSASIEVVSLLGATPIQSTLSDLYISLQRGMFHAAVAPIPTYRSTKVCEVGKYIIKCSLKCAVVPTLINHKSYNSLPADIKAVVDSHTLDANSSLNCNWVEMSTEKDLQWLVKNSGVEVIEIAPEEIARWREAANPIFDKWIANAKKMGVKDPEKVLAQLRSYAEKYNDVNTQIAESAKFKDVLGAAYVNFKEK